MPESEQTQQSDNTEQTNRSNGSDDSTRKTVVRAAAVAAATGATALAARKMLDRNAGDKEQSGEKKSSGKRGARGADATLVTTMANSAWDSARDTVVPMIEDAAENAGAYVAQNSPDIVRDSVIPRFIRGFQKAQESPQDDSE